MTAIVESSTDKNDEAGQATVQPIANTNNSAATRLVLVVTFLLIFAMAARTPLDTDMWWHLSAGQEMLRSGRILQTDVFSFTRAGAHWVSAYWLAQVGMALLVRWGGFLALGAAVAFFATLSIFLVYLQCKGPVFIQAGALLLASVVASVVWSPRPQLLSLVLLALTGYLLYLYKWRGKDWLSALPVVFIIWANVHGGFPLGLALIGAMVSGEVLNHLLGISSGPVLEWRKIGRLAVWAVICAAAVLLNPNGLDMWRLPFMTVNMQVLQQYIPEWASPDFHNILEQTLLWLLLAVLAAVSLSGRRMDGTDLITFLLFGFSALLARRNFGPFAIVAAPLLVRYASAALETAQQHSPILQWIDRRAARQQAVEIPRVQVLKKIINLTLVALLAFVAFGKLYAVTQPALIAGYQTQGYPARASAWLTEHHQPGNLLNEYNWGGYLQWKLRSFPIFVDGRTDLFGDEIVGAWITAVQAGPGWEDVLSRYQVDLVMLQPDRPLLNQLQAAGWKLLYQDTQAVIYGRE